MNQLLLSRRLGSVGPHAFQRAQYERLLHAVTPHSNIKFDAGHIQKTFDSEEPLRSSRPQDATSVSVAVTEENVVAHNGGVNVLAVDPQTSRYLISGGADSTIRLWDFEGVTLRPSHVYSIQQHQSLVLLLVLMHTP